MPALDLANPDTVSIWSLFLQANWLVKLVMLGLLGLSVASWAIIVNKFLLFKKRKEEIKKFETMFWSCHSLEEFYRNIEHKTPQGMEAVFMAAMREWKKSLEKNARMPQGLQTRVDRAMDTAITQEQEEMESQLGFLATIGSASPFIGLFGTVVGIMSSFQAIAASKNTSLAIVAPGIAEALLATAIGLVAAIPAVIAYNKFSSEVHNMTIKLERFADEFSAILSRQIDEKLVART